MEGDYITSRFMLLYSSNIIGVHINKTEMGRTCSTYGGEKRCMQDFSGET